MKKKNSNYKLVIFDDSFEEKPITAVYGIGDNTFHQDITSFDAKYIADIIYEMEQLKMLTRKSLKEYSEVLVKAIKSYSEDTVIETQKHLLSDQKVTQIHKIIMKNPTEQEFLQQIAEI